MSFAPTIPRSTVWLLALLASLATPVSWAADPQPYDVDVRSSGDQPLDDAVRDSASLISLKDKAPVGGFALVRRTEADMDRIRDVLSSFGYYDGMVTVTIGGRDIADPALPGVIDAAPVGRPVTVMVLLNPGRRYHFGRTEIMGAIPPAAGAAIQRALNVTPGQDARAGDVVAAQGRMLTAIREAGYPMAKVDLPPAVLHRDTALLDVSFQFDSGPYATLGPIEVSGLRDVSEAFMRLRLLLRPGEPFRPSAIEAAQKDLLSLDVFSSVRILPGDHLAGNGTLPMNVIVMERPLHAVEAGAAYSTDLGINLNAAWTHRNLFGGAERLMFSGSIQIGGNATTKPGYQVGADFLKPDFLHRDQTLDVGLTALKQSLQAYDQIALIARAGVERKLSPHWSVRAGVLAEEEAITQNGTSRRYHFVGIPLTAKYDSTGSLLDPVSGYRAALSLTPVKSFGNGGGFYFLTQASGSAYFDFDTNGRSVLALRGLVGQASGAGVFGIPPDQRFYAGGNSTVRGYRFQSVGPAFSDRRPTGGTAVSAASIEIRQRIREHYGITAFVDAGQVSDNGAPFTRNWRAGAGVGVRYYTSIGPIRLDVAVPLNKQPGGDRFELYIGLGQAF